jgi:hypothetical protein
MQIIKKSTNKIQRLLILELYFLAVKFVKFVGPDSRVVRISGIRIFWLLLCVDYCIWITVPLIHRTFFSGPCVMEIPVTLIAMKYNLVVTGAVATRLYKEPVACTVTRYRL